MTAPGLNWTDLSDVGEHARRQHKQGGCDMKVSNTHRLSLMAGVASVALIVGAPMQSFAADAAAATDVETVVVTGIRKGIQDAITAKKADTSIIEAVSAEDIGKLPDTSIAESIARLPGVAAQRTNGRAQTLSIRGLGPDYTVTTFNGREQATTNDNRTVEYDQYPSELVSSVKVYKSPDAGMAYQGIAGTADIETVHPLAYGKRAIALNYRREEDGMKTNVPGSQSSGDRYSFTYIDQFMDKTLGVAFGVAHNTTPYQAQTRESWGYADGPNGTKVNGGEKDGIQSSYYERTGYMGIVEYKPNDKLHTTIDAYHSDFKEVQTIRRMEFGTQWGSGSLQPGYTVQNGRIVSGQYNGITTIIENYNNQRDAKVDSLGWNTKYSPADNWTLESDLSWSKVKRTDLRLESTAGTGAAGSVVKDNVSFTTDGNGVTHHTTGLDYSDFSKVFLTDPGGWGGGPQRSGFVGNPRVEDEIKAIKLAATRKLSGSFLSAITVGLNYADRTKSKYEWQSMLYLPTGVSAAVVPAAYRTGKVNTSFFGNPNGMISYDALGLYRSGFWKTIDSRIDANAGQGDRVFDVTQTWSMSEKLTTGYVKADIDTHMFGLPVTGNVGLQYQGVDQSVTQGYTDGNINSVTNAIKISTVHDGATYGDVLPSMNLNYDLGNDVHVRLAAATTVARPRMDDMAGGTSYSVATDSTPNTSNGKITYWSAGGGGNAKLRPWKAQAFDLSIEKYFGRKGYVSAAVYYKELDSYIFNKTTLVSFAGVLLPGQNAASDPVPANYTQANANRVGFSTVKVNGAGGHISGLELTASLPAETFVPALEGFGVIASASFNESEVKPTGTKIALPGLSPEVINTTIYYEKNGFSARISDRYRGTWLGEVPNFDSSLGAHYVKSEDIIDAQIGYEFTSGRLKGLSLNLSGTNLTNTPFVLYDTKGQPNRVLKYEKYGSTYTFSASYKF
jgi:iron complex outermembrane receptor protein